MSPIVKLVSIMAGIALVTTLVLPDRQTVGVIDALRQFITGTFATVMGQTKAATVK